MRRLISIVAAATLSVVFATCDDRANAPTVAPPPDAPRFEIRDGAHNNGNPHFYFLPPIVVNPRATGSFDPAQAPSVTVCQLTGTDCAPVIAQFSMTAGSGSAGGRGAAGGPLYTVNLPSP